MKPILFNADETQFTSYGLGEIDATKAIVTRERNGNYMLYMEYPANGPMAKILKREMKVKADSGVRTKNQTFEISRINRNSDHLIKIYAKHISHKTELMGLNPTVSIASANAGEALKIWADNLVGGIAFDTWSDIDTPNSTNWSIDKVANARQALGGVEGSILDVWGGEYEFDNTLIRLHKQLGRKTPTVLEYGRNILSAEEDEDIEGVYTSIYPFATYTPEVAEGGSNSPDAVMVTLDEKYIDSEHINAYANRRVKIVDLSSSFKEKEVPTQEKLRQAAKVFMKANNVGGPDINTKVKYVDLSSTLDYQSLALVEEIELCDIVPIYYPSLGITNHEGKVVVVEYNVLLDRNESIEIGSIGKGITSSLTQNISSRIDSLEKSQQAIQDNLVPYLINAQGNRVWYVTPDPTVEHKVGDIWFEKNGIYDRMYIWNGEDWDEKIDTEDLAKINRRIDDLNHQVSEMDATIAESDRKAQEALEKAGVSTDLAKEVRKEVLESQKEIQETQVSLIQYAKELQSLGEVSNQTQTEVSGLQQTLEGLNSTVTQTLMDPQNGLIRQIQSQQEQTAEVLKSKLSVSEVDGLIEGKNLLSVSQYTHEKEETAKGVARQLSAIRGGVLSVFGIRNYILASDDFVTSGRKIFKVSDEFIRLAKPGTQFVFSAEVEGSDLVARGRSRYGGQVVIRYTDGTTQWAGAWQLGTEGTETKRISEVYTIPAGKTIQSVEALIDVEIGGKVRVANPMLEISSVPNEWQLALEDGDQQLTTAKLAEYKQTVDSQLAKLSSTVEDPKTGLMKRLENYQTQTAEALQSKLTSTEVESLIDGKGLLSVERYTHDRTETAQIFERTLTELKDTIPSEVGARNYIANSNPSFVTTKGNVYTMRFFDTTIPISEFKGKKVVIRAYVHNTTKARARIQFFPGIYGNWIEPGQEGYSTAIGVADTSNGHENVCLVLDQDIPNATIQHKWEKLELGNIPTDWSPAPEDYRSEWTTKLTQMADSIDLALFNQKGAVSRIHLNQEGIRLKGKLLHLDGQTVIDNGVIKSAHIQSLDAGKIVTGSLDASRVRVINLDANNITANKTSFVQSAWNGINRHTFIGSDGIRVNHSDGSYTLLGAKGIETYIGGTGYRTHYLTNTYMIKGLNFSQHWETAEKYKADGMKYGVRWYKLPSVYAGKNYSATCSLADVEFYDGTEWVLQRTVAYVDQERLAPARAKGEAPIVAYAIFANIKTGKTKAYPVSVSLVVTL